MNKKLDKKGDTAIVKRGSVLAKTSLTPIAVLVLVVALSASAFFVLQRTPEPRDGQFSSADEKLDFEQSEANYIQRVDWMFAPTTVQQMARASKMAVTVRVEGVEAGTPAGNERVLDQEPLATQVISAHVEGGIGAAPDTTIRLFKTGTQSEWPEGDPPYRVGETYLLFLREQQGSDLLMPVAPEGRMFVNDEGRVTSFTSSSVGDELNSLGSVFAIERAVENDIS